jgi:hypothetical protein
MSNVTQEDTAVWPHYKKLWDTIAEIDKQLDSLSDSDAATRRNVIAAMIEQTQDIWASGAESTITNLRNLEGEELVGVVEGIIKALRDEFQEENLKVIDARVAEAPKVEPLITQDQAEELSKQRSALYQTIKQVVNVAKVMDDVDLTMPKTRRGSHGKRGQRAMSKMVWAIDGEEIDPQPRYKDLAEMLGFVETTTKNNKGEDVKNSATKNLTAYLKQKGVDTKEPKDGKLSVELPDGKILDGYIPGEDEDAPARPDDEDDDFGDDDEDGDTSSE